MVHAQKLLAEGLQQTRLIYKKKKKKKKKKKHQSRCASTTNRFDHKA